MQVLVNRAFVILLLLVGVLLLLPGIWLLYLGGSAYYALAGLTTVAVGVLLLRKRMVAQQLYGALLVGTALWSLYEAGLEFFALLPRLALWLGFAAYLLTPWARRGFQSKPDERDQRLVTSWTVAAPTLAVISLLITASAVRYEHHGTGTIRNTSESFSGDWTHYGNSAGGSRFATLDQINPETIGDLKEIWRYRTGVEEDFKATPLAIDGRLYFCAAANVVIALDSETGGELWRFDPGIAPPDEHQYAITCRGVAYHEAPSDYTGECKRRVVTATVAASLIALNADTGEPCSDFGYSGVIDLRVGMSGHLPREYYHTSPPTVAHDKLVVGGLVLDSQRLGLPSGVVRAFDALTGELAWAWDLGNPANSGLPPAGQSYTPGTPNVWSVMSYDPVLDLVFAPTGNANPDYFGGERREFDDRYSSAVVAIDASTGRERWTFQTVHHDIWDYDVPAQPVLVDVTRDEREIPAIAIPTKMGEIFLLDRRDGTPIDELENRPVPQAPEIDEYLSVTQPFSALPSFHPFREEKDMWGLTPIDQMACRIEYRLMRYDGMFTPPTRSGTLIAPGNFGGFNWGSVSVDADNGLLVAAPMLLAHQLLLVTPEQVQAAGPRAARFLGEDHPAVRLDESDPIEALPEVDSSDPYDQMRVKYFGLPRPFMSRLGTGVPCFEPPWSQLAVIDLNSGELLWKRPLGDMRDSGPFNLRSGLAIDVGTAVRAGTLTTRGGLIFVSSTMDATARAFEVRTGKEVWSTRLPGNGQSTPMSYRSESGRQILIVTVPNPSWRYPRDPSTGKYLDSRATRDGKGGYVIAYALPGD
ncbi:MAG: PQQ-binding-like beta-propeller repeat protein [Pseudomonadota bacterium]